MFNTVHRRRRFSNVVNDISSEIPEEGITFKEFLELIGKRGMFMSCILLIAPFLLPISIPGSSSIFGLAILLIITGILLNRPPFIPQRLMNYRISKNSMNALLNGSARILSRVEKFVSPRLPILTSGSHINYVNGALMAISSILLMLPLPVPLTDFLPAYGIFFLAIGSLEKDGYLILAGYAMVIITIIYFSLIAILGLNGVMMILSYLSIHL